MQHLARGGYMVGKLATLHHPDGILIETGSDQDKAIALTSEYLKRDNVTLFEAAIESKGKLVRIDILRKVDGAYDLIEVKSKSYETVPNPGNQQVIPRDLDKYVLDLAYQFFVFREAFPGATVRPYLFLPDKSKNTTIEGLNLLFTISEHINDTSRFRRYEVSFDENRKDDIVRDDLMTLVDVRQQVLDLQTDIEQEADQLLKSLNNGLQKISVPLSKDCFKCEYSLTNDRHPISGYDECWAGYPIVDHHVKDLYYVGMVGGSKKPVVNELIRERKVSLFDIPTTEFHGKRGERQHIQIENTKSNSEWASSEMRTQMGRWKYPLHFIDFEGTITALPFHKGMRPYEPVAFQWSCHTINRLGDEPIHTEWINLEPRFPNFAFAESLMARIGTEGTFFMWSPYENTMLKSIYTQLSKYGHSNPTLRNWLEHVVAIDSSDNGMFVDLCKFALDHYFHPKMKGRVSIKVTLPAVLSSCHSERITHWLNSFEKDVSVFKLDTKGEIVNPYKLLPAVDIFELAERVEDGMGATRAYEHILFGLGKSKMEEVQSYKRALLRYCKLDTLAMVIIWEHWNTM
jgi:hypothetical protein